MRWSTLAALALLIACGESGQSGEGDPGTTAPAATGSSTDPADATGTAPPPGTSAEGWVSDFGGTTISCDLDPVALADSDAAAVTIGDTTLYAGWEQIGDNQNPLLIRVDAGAQVYCQRHETEGPDGRAVGITWDGGDTAYVVYTIVGGGSALDQAANAGWLDAYAPGAISGGGPKVSFIGRVATDDGALQTGTFVIAVKSDNTVNSHNPADAVIVREDGTIEFRGESAHKPIDADRQSSMDCTDYPFSSRYVFSADLSTLVCADCTNCVAQQPCD